MSSRWGEDGYVPTDDEVMLMYHASHLEAIKVPPEYEAMDPVVQQVAMNAFSATHFEWTPSAVESLPSELASLKLETGKQLYNMYKFIASMRKGARV